MAIFSKNILWNFTAMQLYQVSQTPNLPPGWMLRHWGDGAQVGPARDSLMWVLAWATRAGGVLTHVQEWGGGSQGSQRPASLTSLFAMRKGIGNTTILNSGEMEMIIYRGFKWPVDEHTDIQRGFDETCYCLTHRWSCVLVFLEALVFLAFLENQRETDNKYCDSILRWDSMKWKFKDSTN